MPCSLPSPALPHRPRPGLFPGPCRYFGCRFLALLAVLLAAPSIAQEEPKPEPPAAAAHEPTEAGVLTVGVEGLAEGPLRDNVLAHLDIHNFNGKPVPKESELQWLHANAERQIQTALQPFGYYEARIDGSLDRTAAGWQARYRIELGRTLPIVLADIRIYGEAAHDAVFQKLLDQTPLTKGAMLDQPKYEKFKQDLEALATERGYFDARFTEHAIQIDLQAYEAVVKLHYETGKRYQFGDISFKQNILSPKLLARYPRFKPSDPYDANQLLKLQGDLGGSNYFSQVRINPSPDAKTTTVPIDVELEPNKRHKYSAGLGYGTDTGPRGKLKVENRWINRQGHRYEAELQLSPIQSHLGGKYIIPGRDPVTEEYALNASYTRQDYEDQYFERFLLGGSWRQERGNWVRVYNLNLQQEDYQIADEPRFSSFLLVPGLDWTWVNADDRLNTKRGLLFGFGLRGATTALLSDIDFVQATARMKGIYALNDANRFIARAEIGSTWLDDDFQKLPASLRFFTGGDASVRGYAFNSIGPTNARNKVVGGKNLLVGSLEYERMVWNNWGVALFVDTGDAFNGASPELKTGAGLGVRWRSPLGPVRIDFATGLDRPPGDTFRFSFSIGPDL